MKYTVSCAGCGCWYEVDLAFAPKFCAECGSGEIDVWPVKTKARVHAEEVMVALTELRPRLLEAKEAWIALTAEYEDGLQLLRVYKKRGIVTAEELEPYLVAKENVKNINEALKEYRARKREVM